MYEYMSLDKTAVSASEQVSLESASHQRTIEEKDGRRRSDCQLDALYLIGLIVKTDAE